MFKKFCLAVFLLPVLLSCNNDQKPSASKSEDDVDAARNFIRAALDGKFNEARVYMLQDSVNMNWMDIAERNYQKADRDTKVGYASASINIHNVNPVNDSITIVIYSNSFKNDHDTLKILRAGNHWLVDLKYLFQHDDGGAVEKPMLNDSIQK